MSKKVKRKSKKPKDPLAPKSPLSSYMEFVKEERPKVIIDLGSPNLVGMGRELPGVPKKLIHKIKVFYRKSPSRNGQKTF